MYDITGCRPHEISKAQQTQLVDMVEEDLKDMYNNAWGWDREGKSKELFAPVSNFVIARQHGSRDIVGFVMIRFCWDDDDEPEFPVVYVYELNVADNERGSGLGRRLMQSVFAIQAKWGLWKVMLTCFKTNIAALGFYHKLGFGIDIYSPSRCEGWDPVSYEILSNAPDRND